jgi:hypothetical protein
MWNHFPNSSRIQIWEHFKFHWEFIYGDIFSNEYFPVISRIGPQGISWVVIIENATHNTFSKKAGCFNFSNQLFSEMWRGLHFQFCRAHCNSWNTLSVGIESRIPWSASFQVFNSNVSTSHLYKHFLIQFLRFY